MVWLSMHPEQDNSEPLSNAEIDELLHRPTTLPEDISACMRKFPSEEEAKDVGNTVWGFLRIFGMTLNLEKLEGVTIAYDYEQALADLPRGMETKHVLQATRDDIAVGVAMAVPVMRNGKAYSHLVANAAVVRCLVSGSDHERRLAVGILAHEAAHIHDLAMQERMLPGFYGSRIEDTREGWLLQMAHPCWGEYIACRLSAHHAHSFTAAFEQTFYKTLERARETGNNFIKRYRIHGDIGKLMPELMQTYGDLLKYGSYLLGHIDGLAGDFTDLAPKAVETLQREGYFKPTFDRLAKTLRSMHDTYGHWTSADVFNPLKEIAEDLLNEAGIEIEPRPKGVYVNVPYTIETLPR